MKPPPRTRNKPDRNLKSEPASQHSGKLACKWQRVEQRKLFNGLKTLSKTTGGQGEIDYAFLRKRVPSRSIEEIRSVVESLKDKIISGASFQLKKKTWEDQKVRKPIEVWTQMASTVAGSLEETISSAFSQMLIVSSTEPRTLRNCDPPQVLRPPVDDNRPLGCTIPFRPIPCLPVQGGHPGANTACPILVLKTAAPTVGPGRRFPLPSRVVRVANNKFPPPQQQPSTTTGTSPASTCSSETAATSCLPDTAPLATPELASQTVIPVTGQVSPSSISTAMSSVGSSVIQTTQQPSEQHPTTTSTTSALMSTSPSSRVAVFSSATCLTQLRSTALLSVAPSTFRSSTHPKPPLSTPVTASRGRFGHTTIKDGPRNFGDKCIVNFEKIYRYLSVIHRPNEECHLTPMESAIVLDLLMSLPEELLLLECNKIRKHMIQVFQCLSSTADSRMVREMFKEVQQGLCAQTDAQSVTDSNRTDGEQSTAQAADSSDTLDTGGKKRQPNEAQSQSSGSDNASSPSGNADVMGICPTLNPFMVPLKLLTRR